MARKKRRGIILGALGGVLIVGGAGLLAAVALAPDAVEKTYGTLKTQVTGTVDKVQQDVFEELPTVKIGGEGGMPELDAACADNSFVIMPSYEREGVPETAAAHNNCGGDVLLPWDEGQRIQIEGRDEVYEVIDIRYTPKTYASTADLVGLQGDLALQTCFYGEDRMKFVGLEVVDDA